MNRTHRLPQRVHLMPPRARTSLLCGAKSGPFIRQSEQRYLNAFVARGGGLCPDCARIAEETLPPSFRVAVQP